MEKYERYKDSGIEWLGEIPEHWSICVLKNKYKTILGKMLQPNKMRSDDVLLNYLCSVNIKWRAINVENVKSMWFSKEDIRNYVLKKGDLLVTEGGDVGVSCIWNEELAVCGVQNALHIVRPQKYSSSRFLVYWLFFLKKNGYIDLICNKSTIAHLTKDKLGSLPLVNICLSQQEAIANFLDKKCEQIDRAVAQKEQAITLLNERRQIVIQRAVTRGLNPDVPLRDSGIDWIGQIPEHWEVKKLNNVSYKIGDGLHGTPSYDSNGSCYFINGNNLGKNNITITEKTNTVNDREKIKYLIPFTDNTVLISLNGSIGNLSFYNNENIILGKSAGYIILNSIQCKFYIKYYLSSSCVNDCYFKLSLMGTTIGNLSLETLRNTMVAYPPLSEQESIANYLDTVNEKIDRAISLKREEIEKLKEYKQTLINSVVTGKVKITQ